MCASASPPRGRGPLLLLLLTSAFGYNVTLLGSDVRSFAPSPLPGHTVKDPTHYDVVVVGAGVAGLVSTYFLTDQKLKVLLLDKEEMFGGLAAGGIDQRGGARYGRGAAYFSKPYPEEQHILKHFGYSNYLTYNISEPIDSFYWNGEMYVGIWEEKTLKRLPASFTLFKACLKLADDMMLVPNQPIEEAQHLALDALSAAEWIREMPLFASNLRATNTSYQPEVNVIKALQLFEHDNRVNRTDPMGDVIGLLDLFCRSALGTTTDKVSAVAFANFYGSEIEARFTSTTGTGIAARYMVEALVKRTDVLTMRTQATVTRITSRKDSATVTYSFGGKTHAAQARYVVFAGQLGLAPKIIDGLASTEQGRLMAALEYSHYSVHVAFVEGHPHRSTYDTWVRAKDYTEADFTDVIMGRWMDPAINGYAGLRDIQADGQFKVAPPDNDGIVTIFHPLRIGTIDKAYGDAASIALARRSVTRLLGMWPPKENGKALGTPLIVQSVETSRWPFSVHVAPPGHFTSRAKILRAGYGRVHFANNNIGTPSFEEALFRGHCAANQVLLALNSSFKFESWTRCPVYASNAAAKTK